MPTSPPRGCSAVKPAAQLGPAHVVIVVTQPILLMVATAFSCDAEQSSKWVRLHFGSHVMLVIACPITL